MAVRALALSGGGARGSFQLGALGAIYRVYGFRPDMIAGTSVGAVNGIKLALAKPPPVNDPAVILASVAAGNTDSGLTALRALEAEWDTFTTVDDFFLIQPLFAGTLLEDAVNMMNAPSDGAPPLSATVGPEIDKLSALLAIPIVGEILGPVALQGLKGAAIAVLTGDAVFNLNPVRDRLNDPMKLKLADLAAGTPLYLATVALESGRLRYIDGKGTFTERDGRTPVISKLTDSDIDSALDENLNPLDPARANGIKDLIARYADAVTAITLGHSSYRAATTTTAQRRAILRDIGRNIERAKYLLDELHRQVQGLRLSVYVDPRIGVIASAAIPVFFDPVVIGTERYVDGGLRELIPMGIVTRNGVTDVVGICCSPLELPLVDDMANAGLPAVGLRALTEIALNEVSYGDIAEARASGITCTMVAPTFSVHSGLEVKPWLMQISSDYGWMRACDEMQPAAAADRFDFRTLSDLITTFRMRSSELEEVIANNDTFYKASFIRGEVVMLRTYRWLIRELLATRVARGLPQHVRARWWWVGLGGAFGQQSVWNKLAAYSSNGTEVLVANEVADPDGYAPDSGSLVDAGNDGVYWIVRGAMFFAPGETETSTAHTPTLVVPHETVLGLPNVPRGNHLIAEQAVPTDLWIVHNGKRYHASTALIAASGLTGQPVAIVPTGGLAQIQDGGSAYWLGGLYVSNSAGNLVERWEPTPQVEGRTATAAIGMKNRSARPITVSGLTITSSQDSGATRVFTVTSTLPLTVQANTLTWVSVQIGPATAGPITGMVAVTCDDPTVPQFSVPLESSATPLGAHGQLQITPASVDFGTVPVAQTAATSITLTNAGTRDLGVNSQITNAVPAGQFTVPLSSGPAIHPSTSATVYISCTPTVRGQLVATLSADATSQTDTPYPFQQHIDVPISATATAPVVFLAGQPLPTRRPWPFRPRPKQPQIELLLLDFGSLAPGSTANRRFWIRNVGDATLSVSGVDSRNRGVVAFGIPNLTIFPALIAPGGELAVDASFLAPNVRGLPVRGQLEIVSDDPARPRAVLSVEGRVAGPHLSPQPVEVLSLNWGMPPTGELTIVSDGTDPSKLVKVGVSNLDFSISGFPTLPAVLVPGTVLTISVTYTGTSPGQHNAYLELDHDAVKTSIILKATTT